MGVDYSKLIEAAILAPTPDNNQPWRFAVRDQRLLIFLDPSRTLPSDVNGMFDLVGLGAAVENACIAARQSGYEPGVDLADCSADMLRDPARPTASIEFVAGGSSDPLYPYLGSRCTCRRLYSKNQIPVGALDQMSQAVQQFPAVRVDWATDRPQIAQLARLMAASDLLRFQYEPFHNELFRQLRFTVDEVERTRDGLDVRTLELPLGAAWILRQLRPWSRMRRIHQFGLGWLLTMPSELAVKRSGAIGILSVSQPNVEHYLQGGMAFERLWLTATSLDLALQPLGSLPIFLAHWDQLSGSRLGDVQIEKVRHLSKNLRDIVPQMSGRVVQIMFRVGQSTPPPFRSIRREVADVCNTSSLL